MKNKNSFLKFFSTYKNHFIWRQKKNQRKRLLALFELTKKINNKNNNSETAMVKDGKKLKLPFEKKTKYNVLPEKRI